MPQAWFLDLGYVTLHLQVLGYALDGMELEDDAKANPQVRNFSGYYTNYLAIISTLIVRLKVLTSWKRRRNPRFLGR